MKLSRKERTALGIVVVAILLFNVGMFIYTRVVSPASDSVAGASSDRGEGTGGDSNSAYGKNNSAYNKSSDAYGDSNDTQNGATQQSEPANEPQEFLFDPNTADSATFVAMGLRPNTARAIIHYRMAGGRFRKPDDFARIYTLSREDFRRLRPYIRIHKTYSLHDNSRHASRHDYSAHYNYKKHPNATEDHPRRYSTDTSASASSRPKYIRKLRPGQKVDLSTADTTDLQRIPEIGPYYAAKIIRYRHRMGGFVSTAQLKEVSGLPDDICQWVCVGKPQITRLKINSMTFGQLLRHPYLNFEQVEAIFNHRQLYGAIHSFQDLSTYSVFSSSDIERLTPYVSFQ